MARTNRRKLILDEALDNFVTNGFEGTSVGDLASKTGMSKAAVSYHFPSKDDLLVELASPLLDRLELIVPAPDQPPVWPDGVQELLAHYLDALLQHRDTAVWLDGDRSVLLHPEVGPRMRSNNKRMRQALIGRPLTTRTRIAASVALGALWRPVRNLDVEELADHRDLLVEAAIAPLRIVR